MHTITTSEAFSAHIRAMGRQSCSNPVLLNLSDLKDSVGFNEDNLAAWLHEDEIERLGQFKLEKRRREWLAGRICAKIAINDYFSTNCRDRMLPAFSELTIANSETGRPFLIRHNGERLGKGPDISISHNGNLALAIAAQACCGVDIQKTGDALIRVKERFCTAQEEQLLLPAAQKSNPLIHLAMLWATKEAAKKALSISAMPGFLDLVLIGIEKIGPEEWFFIFKTHLRQARLPSSEIRVITTCYRDYGLGVCIP